MYCSRSTCLFVMLAVSSITYKYDVPHSVYPVHLSYLYMYTVCTHSDTQLSIYIMLYCVR